MGISLKTPQNLISDIKRYADSVDETLIKTAYTFALSKHGTQIRESGDPFFSHPIEVTEILISLKMDQDTIVAGMLHDTVEDTDTTIEEIENLFGKNIAKIVNGVTKLSKFELSSIAEKQTENFKKLLLSAAADIRVLVIKLADRLHNMRTLKYKRKQSRRRYIAKETLEIYAPLAERIGIITIKEELQDIAFMEFHPDIHESIKSRLRKLYESSEQTVATITNKLSELSKTIGINCVITGRIKSPYSVWEKLNVRNISFEQLSDIMAFRIIVDTIPQCYQVLGKIHRNYPLIPGRFKDYISTPKNNSYQSLHTCVIGPLNKRIEIQIRTKEMHLIAEYGIAAHWDYKLGGVSGKAKSKVNRQWMNNLLNILQNTSGIEEFLKSSKTEILSSDSIFCITPDGTIISLPKGASALDFAYYIHSDIGNHAIEAKINGVLSPLQTAVENGDQIEILIDFQSSPKSSWEDFVVTIKAKAALRKALNGFEREKTEIIGKSNFDEFFQKRDIKISETELKNIAKSLKFRSISNFFYSIGACETTMRDVLLVYNKLQQTNLELYSDEEEISKCIQKKTFPVLGLPNLPILPTDCCAPVSGDRIVGNVFKNKGVEIHFENCVISKSREYSSEARIIPLSWKTEAFDKDKKYLARLSISIMHEPGNLAKVAEIIERREGGIMNLKIGETFKNFVQLQIELEVKDIAQLTMIIADLRSAEFVQKVIRG
ncbi:MAG: RelA/SpoT family protein [Holosporales bacterium]|jgi:GTP pyrophosphokinase|nr:RelA/SpoT family protein [Holosporales bacterium]